MITKFDLEDAKNGSKIKEQLLVEAEKEVQESKKDLAIKLIEFYADRLIKNNFVTQKELRK